MKSRYDRGMDMLKKVDNIHGKKVIATLNAVSPALSQLLAEVFGDIYSRPELTLQERELVTLSSLIAQGGCEAQLSVHVNAALNVGIAPEKITEVCIHSIPYTGFPRVLNGVFIVQDVLKGRKDKE